MVAGLHIEDGGLKHHRTVRPFGHRDVNRPLDLVGPTGWADCHLGLPPSAIMRTGGECAGSRQQGGQALRKKTDFIQDLTLNAVGAVPSDAQRQGRVYDSTDNPCLPPAASLIEMSGTTANPAEPTEKRAGILRPLPRVHLRNQGERAGRVDA